MKFPRIAVIVGFTGLAVTPSFGQAVTGTSLSITGGGTSTLSGPLNVVGSIDSDNNQFTFGTQSSSYGAALLYTDNSVDTLKFLINRSPASWLWVHNTNIPAMRLDSAHQLLLYNAAGTTAGITLTPVSNRIALGTATLTGSGANLTVGGALTVASGITNTTGAFTSPTALSLTAGGSNQNITLTPSGTGYTILNGNVGIGTTSPQRALQVSSSDVAGVTIESFNTSPHSGAIRFGDNTGWKFHIGRSRNTNGGALNSGAAGALATFQDNGNVGIGTTTPSVRLDVVGDGSNGAMINARSRQTNSYLNLITGATDDAVGEFAFERTGANAGNIYVGGNATGNIVFRSAGYTYKMMINSLGNVGIGTGSPGTKLEVNGNVSLNYGHLMLIPGAGSVATDGNYGLYWQSNGLGAGASSYGIYRTAGPWSANNYQQLMMRFDTGIIIDGGNLYGKSGTVLQPNGGNVGIGTSAPVTKLNLQDAQPELSMGLNADPTTYNRFGFNTSYQGYWAQNATWNGTQWNHVENTGYNGAAIKLQQYYGSFQIDTADVGVTTNPIAWNTRFYLANNGNVGIGTTTPTHKLAVKGAIRAQEIIVDNTNWADYVFDESYNLAPLSDVEAHIKAKKHLPGIPSAAEIAEHGVSMGDMQSKLLSKIEELTLHMIAQEKRMASYEKENATLRQKISALEATQP